MSNIVAFPINNEPSYACVVEFTNDKNQPFIYDFFLKETIEVQVQNMFMDFLEQAKDQNPEDAELTAFFYAERVLDVTETNDA